MGAAARLVAIVARAIAHVFYRVDIVGGVPQVGPVLLLPNHPNALLDPALVIATAGRPVRFLAKSTLFNGAFGPVLGAAGAIPVYRAQDTADTSRNADTFAAVDAALARGEAVCLFPEGISHSSGRLEPLRTGAARMAVSALSAGVDVRLVPAGINHEQKTAFRSRVTIAYGQAFAPRSRDVRDITAEIAGHMRELLVEADPERDAALVDRIDRVYDAERPLSRDPQAALLRRRAIAAGLQRIRSDRPEWYAAAILQFRRYDERMARFGLSDQSLDWNLSAGAAARFLAREIPAAVVLGPLALFAVLVFAVPYSLTSTTARLSREHDVTATMKALAGAMIYAGWIAALGAVVWWRWGTAAGAAVALASPALAVAGLFAIERESAAWRTARAWLALRSRRNLTRTTLRRRRAELAAVLDDMHEWIHG